MESELFPIAPSRLDSHISSFPSIHATIRKLSLFIRFFSAPLSRFFAICDDPTSRSLTSNDGTRSAFSMAPCRTINATGQDGGRGELTRPAERADEVKDHRSTFESQAFQMVTANTKIRAATDTGAVAVPERAIPTPENGSDRPCPSNWFCLCPIPTPFSDYERPIRHA
jgi:hypothetical protein